MIPIMRANMIIPPTVILKETSFTKKPSGASACVPVSKIHQDMDKMLSIGIFQVKGFKPKSEILTRISNKRPRHPRSTRNTMILQKHRKQGSPHNDKDKGQT